MINTGLVDIREGLVRQSGPWRKPRKVSDVRPRQFDRAIQPSKLVFGGRSILDTTSVARNDGSSSNGLDPGYTYRPVPEVADWVKPEHKCAFLLCVSLYSKPVRFIYDYSLQPTMTTARVGVWQNSRGGYFVGLRGTTFLSTGSGDDLGDDIQIALSKAAKPDLSLVREATAVVSMLRQKGVKYIMIGGHSLGGYAAISIGATFGLNTCSFNGAAPPISPVLLGPGRELATHYHIVGDLISTHMGCEAADVIRVDKKMTFGFTTPHSTDRFYARDPTTRLVDATAEDVALCVWAATNPPVPETLLISLIVYNNPIPCSVRSKNPGDVFAASVIIGQVAYVMIASGGVMKLMQYLDYVKQGASAQALTQPEIQMLSMQELTGESTVEVVGEGVTEVVVEGAAEAVAGEVASAEAAAAAVALEDGFGIAMAEVFELGIELLEFLPFLLL